MIIQIIGIGCILAMLIVGYTKQDFGLFACGILNVIFMGILIVQHGGFYD